MPPGGVRPASLRAAGGGRGGARSGGCADRKPRDGGRVGLDRARHPRAVRARGGCVLLLLRDEARRPLPRAPAGGGRGRARIRLRHRRLDRARDRERRQPAPRHGAVDRRAAKRLPGDKARRHGRAGDRRHLLHGRRRHYAVSLRGWQGFLPGRARSRRRGRHGQARAVRRMRVAVLGAGAGGAAAAVELTLRGNAVRLWNRSRATLEPFRGSVRCEGLLGSGEVRPEAISAELGEVLDGSDAVVVCLPALAHEAVAEALAVAGVSVPIVLNPGHTGGALHFRRVFGGAGVALPPLAEFSTLTYVARKSAPGTVTISGVAGRVRSAALPGGDEALSVARELFPAATLGRAVLAPDLASV